VSTALDALVHGLPDVGVVLKQLWKCDVQYKIVLPQCQTMLLQCDVQWPHRALRPCVLGDQFLHLFAGTFHANEVLS
jgi:hypothetical protein